MSIRRYRAEDFDAVASLWEDVGFNMPPNEPRRDIEFLLRHDNAVLLVDDVDGTVMGTILAGHDGHRGWLYRFAVWPEHRGKGHGRALFAAAEQWLAARGLVKIELLIRGDNMRVKPYYERVGYEQTPRIVMARLVSDAERRAAILKIPVVITYLEMTQKPAHETLPMPPGKVALLRAEHMPIAMFRYLYGAVGGPWFWWERCLMSDEEIATIIHDPQVELYLLHVDGCPAGYAEIDRRKDGIVNINHLGLLPDFIGRGYGQFLLRQSIETAWMTDPERVTVDTCTLDHPGALPAYQRAGFTPYAQKRMEIDDPRVDGHIPAAFEPNLP
ncbi:MAG: GNAT family acetyltransferase [Dongiaceae bacterium]